MGPSHPGEHTVIPRSARVLVVVQNMPLAYDRRVRSECAALVAAGYGVTVICPKADPAEPDRHLLDDVVVRSYPAPGEAHGLWSYVVEFVVCWLWTARRSVTTARREGFDVLQACNPPDTYWLLGLLWKLAGKRFVFDQHDLCPDLYEARFGRTGLLYRALLLLERVSYRVADHVIVTNESYRETALSRGGLARERTSVVMSTPDASAMVRSAAATPSLRSNRRYLVCYVGIMGPQDGVDRLVEAIDHYVNVLGRTDCHFGLLGYGDSLEALRSRASELGLDDVVTFTGRVDHGEIGRWLSTASVGMTPDPPTEFNHRSSMNKTLEYMAHGVPVVATDLRQTRRDAADAGCYVPGGTPEGLALALADLLDDPARRRQASRVGRLRIERELAWSTQAAAYVAAVDTVCARRVTNRPVEARVRAKTRPVRSPTGTIDVPSQRAPGAPAMSKEH